MITTCGAPQLVNFGQTNSTKQGSGGGSYEGGMELFVSNNNHTIHAIVHNIDIVTMDNSE